jgi:hypothetical protein
MLISQSDVVQGYPGSLPLALPGAPGTFEKDSAKLSKSIVGVRRLGDIAPDVSTKEI